MTATVTRTGFHRLRIARVDRLCDDAAAVTFAVPDELRETFMFAPGQSLTVRREVDGVEHRRSYSICAPAGAAPRIGVREVVGGAVSGWLVHEVRAGDEVDVSPPSGNFTPGPDAGGEHVLIAAGSGITPVLSIAATLLARPDTRLTLVYGNRRSDSVMFADEVADLKDAHPTRLRLVHVLSREAQEVDLFSGRLDRAKLDVLLPALGVVEPAAQYWLCGPYGMTTAARDVLTGNGVDPRRVHRELFYVEDSAPPPAVHPDARATAGVEVNVVLDGRATTLSVPDGVTVLDAAQRVRPDLPFACKGGVCGTCRARVTAGEVRMRRNFALEQHEVDDGFVLTCQSLCVAGPVTVDFDS